MKSILLIGGGSGVAKLLRRLRKFDGVNLSAIVTTFDSGGSTGVLRKRFGMPAVGDLRNANSALLPAEFAELLESRLPNGHAVGNLILAYLTQQYGFERATQLFLDPRIIPVSYAARDLIATLANGKKLVGEHLLDEPPAKWQDVRITELSLSASAALNPAARRAIAAADLIVVGPGSLFGSLLVNFLVKDLARVVHASRAKKILVLPARQAFGHKGETVKESVRRFPVTFDEVWTTKDPKWDRKKLAKRIVSILR